MLIEDAHISFHQGTFFFWKEGWLLPIVDSAASVIMLENISTIMSMSVEKFGWRRVSNSLLANKLSMVLEKADQLGFRRSHLGVDFSVGWDLSSFKVIGQWSMLLYEVWTDQSIDPPNDADAIDKSMVEKLF